MRAGQEEKNVSNQHVNVEHAQSYQALEKTHLAELNQKDRLAELNQEQLELFKLSDETKLVLRAPALLPGLLFSSEVITYTKKKIAVGANEVHIIYKNGEPESFVWKTSPTTVKQAVRIGIIPTEALSSKVIGALGNYHSQITLHRAHKEGMVSDKYPLKIALLEAVQHRIELLQPLERLVNSYDDSLSADENREKIKCVLEECKNLLEANTVTFGQRNNFIDSYDSEAPQKLTEYLSDDAELIQTLITRLSREKLTPDYLKNFLSPTGPHSLMTSIKFLMQSAIKQTQEINQNITHARLDTDWLPHSLFRGDLNSYCEDALREIDNFEADYHNKILAAHQGDFSIEEVERKGEEEKKIIVDFAYLKKNKQAIDTALMAICFQEGVDKIEYDDATEQFQLVASGDDRVDHTYPLDQTRRTKWWFGSAAVESIEELTEASKPKPSNKWYTPVTNAFFKFTSASLYILKRIGAAVVNFFSGLILTTLDLLWGMLGGIFNKPVTSLVSLVKIKIQKQKPKTKFAELSSEMNIIREPIVFQFGRWLGQVIRGVTWELIEGVSVVAKQLTFGLPDVLKDDYYVNGFGGLRNEKEIMVDFESEIKEIGKAFENVDKKLNEEHKKIDPNKVGLFCDKPLSKEVQIRIARTPYSLNSGEWDDISNASVRGLKTFVETFTHPIHAKHPLLGLIFNAVYMIGGFSVLIPHNVPVPVWYTKFSMALAKKMARGQLSRAVGSGLTQAQITMGMIEALYHGRKSWLADGINLIERNAVEILIVVSLAVLWGEFLRVYVPGLGSYIEEEMGDIGFITLGSAGAKIGLILVELLEVKEKEKRDFSLEEQLLSNLKNELKEAYKKSKNIEPSDEELNAIIANITSEEAIHAIQPAIAIQREARDFEITSDKKNFLNRLSFIHKLESNAHLLPHLSSRRKRELLELTKTKFSDQPEMVAALESKLNPANPQSVAMRSIIVLLGHIPAIVRDLSSIFTGNIQALKDHAKKIEKDLVRVARFLGKLTQLVVLILHAIIYTPFRAIFDTLLNGVIARMEGWFRGNSHYVSKKTYAFSTSLRQFYEKTRQEVSRPTDYLCKSVTTPAPEVVFQRATMTNASRLFAEKRLVSASKVSTISTSKASL